MLYPSCRDIKSELSIPEEKLEKVFFDFHSAEYLINRAPSNLKDSLRVVYQKQIFSIHKINKEDFLHDLNLLKQNPEKFLKFYENVEKYGNELKNSTLQELNKNKLNQGESML